MAGPDGGAGVPREKIVAAHGNFDTCTCVETGEKVLVDGPHNILALEPYHTRIPIHPCTDTHNKLFWLTRSGILLA